MKMLTLLSLVAVLCGCRGQGHEIAKEKKDPNWKGGPVQNILVIGLYDDKAYRVSAEGVCVQEFAAKGITSKASHGIIPSLNTTKSPSATQSAIAGKGFDAILSVSTLKSAEKFDYEAHAATYAFVRLLGSEGTFTRMGGYAGEHEQATSSWTSACGTPKR